MPDRKKFDWDHRPKSYWVFRDAKQQVHATVKGEARRTFVDFFEGDVGDAIREDHFLTKPGLEEQERAAWGGAHPACLGGEFLADLEEGEVEIARLTLASVTGDVISLRARRKAGRIHYSVRDEYEDEDGGLWQYRFAPKTSSEPLSMDEIVRLIDSIVQIGRGDEFPAEKPAANGAPLFTAWLLDSQLCHVDPESLLGFVTVSSAFYPDLESWYKAVCDEWCARALEDQLEPCDDCGDLFDPVSDHECPEGLEQDRLRREQSKLQEERRASLIAPFRDRIRQVVDDWKPLNPGGGRIFNVRAGSLERYLEDYVVVNGSMPAGVHEVKYRFMSPELRSMQVDFDTLAEELVSGAPSR